MLQSELRKLREKIRQAVQKHRYGDEDVVNESHHQYAIISMGEMASRDRGPRKSPRKRATVLKILACNTLDAYLVCNPVTLTFVHPSN